jgi:lipopolysaccharide/colanic/teichoic acid biosynthesis glycosyltransferase
MAEPDLVRASVKAGAGQPPPSDEASPATTVLLARLNRRGFRLLMLADAVVLTVILVGSMIWRDGLDWPTFPPATYAVSFPIVLSIFLSSLYFGGLYEREPRLGAPPVLPRVARQTLAAGGLVALLRLAVPGVGRALELPPSIALALPLPNLVTLIVLGAVGVATNRSLAHRLRTRREGPPKIVLAGSEADLEVARNQLDVDRQSAVVVAEVTQVVDLLDTVRVSGASDVVLVSSGWVDDLYPTEVQAFDRAGVAVLLRVTARETLYGLERIREVGGLPFVLLRAQTMPRSRARFKRFFDLVVLVVTMPAWLLVIGLVALYQLLAAGRPLLFQQARIGAGERPFEMVKFRTMAVDAEEDGRGARLATLEDPRIVPACRWIRATRMDELPQLWNVFRGEMSLVGPRPERPELTAGFEQRIAGYARRHELPPGLTGLAQIHGRYHTDPEYKLGYDLQYLVNWSPVLDLEILFKTVWVVLARRI